MKHLLKMALFLSAALLSACSGKLYEISTTEKDGIPFFPLESATFLTNVYEQAWYEVQVEIKDKDLVFASTWVTESPQCAAVVRSDIGTRGSVPNALAAYKEWNKHVEWLTTCDALSPEQAVSLNEEDGASSDDNSKQCACIADASLKLDAPSRLTGEDFKNLPVVEFRKEIEQVPAEQPSYINIQTSIVGTASATVSLSETGTLTSAQASKSPTTLSTILESLPVGDVVTSILGIDSSDQTMKLQGVQQQESYARVSVVPVVRLYSHRCREAKDAASSCEKVHFSVTEKKSPIGNDADSDGITFSGSIEVPEDG